MDKKTDVYTHIFAGLENDLFMCLPWSRENIHILSVVVSGEEEQVCVFQREVALNIHICKLCRLING